MALTKTKELEFRVGGGKQKGVSPVLIWLHSSPNKHAVVFKLLSCAPFSLLGQKSDTVLINGMEDR